MRELDKEEKSPRYILFIGITGIVFLLLILKFYLVHYPQQIIQTQILISLNFLRIIVMHQLLTL